MSQPYPVPIPIPQPKSRPLPDSRGIPDTLNLFFLPAARLVKGWVLSNFFNFFNFNFDM